MTPLLVVFTYSRQNFLCQSWEHFRRTYRDYWANFSMFNIGKCDWIKSIKRAKSTWNIHKSRNNPGSKLRGTKLTVNINIDLMTHLREVGTMCLSPSSAWALASSGTRLLSEVSTPEPEPGGWNMTTVRGNVKWNDVRLLGFWWIVFEIEFYHQYWKSCECVGTVLVFLCEFKCLHVTFLPYHCQCHWQTFM